MNISVLATGAQYQCEGEVSLLGTMERLQNDEPGVCLVRTASHYYGVEVEVREGKKVLAKVSRFDVLDILELMRRAGFGVLKGKVSHVCCDGGWFTVTVEAPDDFVSCKMTVSDCWERWALPDIPLMSDLPGRCEVESTISYLDAALHCPLDFDSNMTVEYLSDLIRMSRYDVTMETQQALKMFRNMVDASPDATIHAMMEELVKSINDMGGSQRREEFEELYYQMLVDSDEATDMINAWYSSFAYTKADDITLDEIRRDKLREIEHSLQTLPADLYREVDRKGRLLHLLLYKDIPYEKYRGLMSALIMRDHLLDELETVIEYGGSDAASLSPGSPLDTPEAERLWTIAIEHGWVDADHQPIMKSQTKAALLASVMADMLRLSPRWEPFELQWGIKDLATKFSKAHDFIYYGETMNTMINAMR